MTPTVAAIIERLDLQPLPGEGGWFRRSWESDHSLRVGGEERLAATCIWFLITPDNPSRLHRVRGPEMFHFYAGSGVDMVQIDAAGAVSEFRLGADVLAGEHPQCVVPGGVWQALRVAEGGEYALMAASMTPGYDERDFELADRADLLRQFPQHRRLIEACA